MTWRYVCSEEFDVHEDYGKAQSEGETGGEDESRYEAADAADVVPMNHVTDAVDVWNAGYERENTGSKGYVGSGTPPEDKASGGDDSRETAGNDGGYAYVEVHGVQLVLDIESVNCGKKDNQHGHGIATEK